MALSVDKALFRKAQSHLKAGELAEAEALYKEVLSKIKPDYADAYNNMGIALRDKGEARGSAHRQLQTRLSRSSLTIVAQPL